MSFCTLKSGVVICGLDSGVLIHTLNSLLVSPGRKRVKHNLDNGYPLALTAVTGAHKGGYDGYIKFLQP